MTDRRRALPSVDRLLRAPAIAALGAATGREALVRATRQALAMVRGDQGAAPADDAGWASLVSTQLEAATTPTLRRVVNATGVVLHTNLGRAPLAQEAIDAIAEVAAHYNTLEYDADRGARGSRHLHCSALLMELTGAPAALVVNNAASALLLALAVAAEGGETIVSRGELIEIGGGFRIPEIMEKSGTRLVEVGTTNRTRVGDYEKALMAHGSWLMAGKGARRRSPSAISHQPSAILKVHRSNFRLEGFTAEASLEELAALGKKKRAPVLYDLGGGLMAELDVPGLTGEPTLPAAARSGATAVVASGDKLLGGPQAGIVVGTAKFVAACRAHPLARAVRADKLTLAALAATLNLHRDPGVAAHRIPVLRMLKASVPHLAQRADALRALLPGAARGAVVATRAAVGGGAFPGAELESRGVAIDAAGLRPDALAERLRRRRIPVVGTVQKGRLVLDVRALLEGDDAIVAAAVAGALA